jgi:formate dehydrogenase major subunit
VLGLARALGCDWPEYPDAEAVWDELADLCPNWYGIRYPRLEEHGLQWPCVSADDPGTPFLHAGQTARPGGKGKFHPVEYQPPIEEPDSDYPFVLTTGRTLYHYNSATMTMREDGILDKQQEPFFELAPEDASALGVVDGDLMRLVWMSLHFAEARVNWLTHDVGDPLIGTPEYKVSAVRLERA